MHKTGNRSAFWKRIASKHGCITSVIEDGLTEASAFEREMHWISHFKDLGQCAANFTLGGDGVRVDERWWGDAISKSMMGIQRPRGELSPSYKALPADVMLEMYCTKGLGVVAIAAALGASSTTVWERLKSLGVDIRGVGQHKKPILCVQTGNVFPSISEAATRCGVLRENIRKVLAGKYKTTGGLSFIYKE
jgi:hypothetical protein